MAMAEAFAKCLVAHRHEDQQSIQRQDTAFLLFFKTDGEGSVVKVLWELSQAWKAQKQEPASLSQPMRVVLFQAVLTELFGRITKVQNDGAIKVQALKMGWIVEEGAGSPEHTVAFPDLQWDADKKHVPLQGSRPIQQRDMNLLTMLIQMAPPPPLAAEHAGPTLAFLLEIGLRSQEMQKLYDLN